MRAFALVCLFTAAACTGGPFVRLTVDGIPAQTVTLVVAATLGGHDATPERFEISDRSAQSLALSYPSSLGSWLEIVITALDPNGCEVGWTSQVVVLRSYDSNLIDVNVVLGPGVDPPLCNRQRSPSMIYIMEGDYVFGCDKDSDADCAPDESPARTITLPVAYEIDAFEVTVDAYNDCIEHGPCTTPHDSLTTSPGSLPPNVARDSVDWFQAQAFCAWRGKHLPTEAQWEAAARGFNFIPYPWGDAAPDCDFANFAPGIGEENACLHFNRELNTVGSHPAGISPYGVFDMAGNVSEWTADWYAVRSLLTDPEFIAGPDTGTARVVKGGSYLSPAESLRAAFRIGYPPDGSFSTSDGTVIDASTGTIDRGFRCAR
jgi:formylglycine-generating enzyme required for sulfatase activity